MCRYARKGVVDDMFDISVCEGTEHGIGEEV